MSALRPELPKGYKTPLPREEVLRRLYKSVARRRSLIRGQLRDNGHRCALGCIADDAMSTGGITMLTAVADEIASVNDKLGPRSSPKRRWEYVMRWLRKQLAIIDSKSDRGAKR